MLRLFGRVNGQFLADAPYESKNTFLVVYPSWTADPAPERVLVPEAAVQSAQEWTGRPLVAAPNAPWLDLGTYPIPAATASRYDDDAINIMGHAPTAYSGIPDIDKNEGDNEVRSLDLGSISLPLTVLLENAGNPVMEREDVPMIDAVMFQDLQRLAMLRIAGDDKLGAALENPVGFLGETRFKTLTLLALGGATKMSMSFRAAVVGEEAARAYVQARRALPDPQRFGTPAFAQQAMRVLNDLQMHYWERWTDLPPAPGMSTAARFPATPFSKLSSALHMITYKTQAGDLPTVAFGMQQPAQRGLGGRATPDAELGRAVGHITRMLMGSTLAAGFTPDSWATALESALNREGAPLSNEAHRAYVASMEVLCYGAHAFNYQSDLCHPNLAAIPLAARPLFVNQAASTLVPASVLDEVAGVPSPHADLHAAQRWTLAAGTYTGMVQALATHLSQLAVGEVSDLRGPVDFRASHALAAAAAGASGGAPNLRDPKHFVIQTERWSIANGNFSQGEDCEDVGMAIVNAHESTRTHLAEWLDRPALRDAAPPLQRRILTLYHAVLDATMAGMVGGTVSDPYVSGAAKQSKTRHKHEQTPILGDEKSRTWKEGGHGYALILSKAALAERMLTGLTAANAEERARLETMLRDVVKNQSPGFATLPPLVGEGTGPVFPEIRAAEEVGRDLADTDRYVRSIYACKKFGIALKFPEGGEYKALADFVRIPTYPHEMWARPDPRQYTSPFYFMVLHAIWPRAYAEWSPLLGQTVTVDMKAKVRGVEIGAFLRGAPHIGLASTYGARYTRAAWEKEVEPYIMRVVAHQPLGGYARHERPAMITQLAQPVPAAALVSLSDRALTTAKLTGVFDSAAANALKVPLRAGELVTTTPLDTWAFGPADAAAMHVIETAAHNPKLTTIQLYVPAWKLAGRGIAKGQEMLGTLQRLQQRGDIVAFAMLRDKRTLQHNDNLRLIIALPVPDAINDPDYPRAH